MNWRMVLSVVLKDLVDVVRNPYLLFSIILPIGFSLLFQVIMPNQQEIGRYKMLLYDPEDSRYGIILQEHQSLDILLVASEAEVEKQIKADKEAIGGIVILPGFDAALERGEKPKVKVFVNEKSLGWKQFVFRSIIDDQAWLLVRQEFPIELVWNDKESAESEIQGRVITFDFTYFIMLLLLVTGLIMVGVCVVPMLMVEEKEKHTLEVLLVAPGGPMEITAGKGLVGLVYSLLVAGLLLALNNGFVGNWQVTLLTVVLGALFTTGIGLLIGMALKILQQVYTVSSVVMLVLIFPTMVSIFGLPEPFSAILYLFPTYYLNQLLIISLSGSATLSNIAPRLTILAVSVFLVFFAVIWMLHRERNWYWQTSRNQ
ncbi:MAG: ABC transporter permease [Anaerolineae bacterium]|nr:ABC transporter permease [Anaerolineae bacterium]